MRRLLVNTSTHSKIYSYISQLGLWETGHTNFGVLLSMQTCRADFLFGVLDVGAYIF